MRIINTLPQLDTAFPDGRFCMDAWRAYAAEISPALPAMCEDDAACYDFDRDVLPVMLHALAAQDARRELARSFTAAEAALRQNITALYGYEPDVLVVLYLGLCNAAGWAAVLDGKPAILLGIEKIIELNWQGERDMQGLLFHELGHLWHDAAGYIPCDGDSQRLRSVQQLYCEGVAMRCEQRLCGEERFYHQDKGGWLRWCEGHAPAIRAEYLRRLLADESTQDFFGDWCAWQGYSDVGYYLGCEFIRWMEGRYSFREIAALQPEAVAAQLQEYLAA